jgi:hypothetical protein
MVSFFSRRQNKIQTDVADLETFLENSLGPDASMNSPRFLEKAMKTFGPCVWSTLILHIGINHAKAPESLEAIINEAINVRFSSLRCFRSQNAGQPQATTAWYEVVLRFKTSGPDLLRRIAETRLSGFSVACGALQK